MPERITNRDAQYAYDIVKAICAEVGPGLPASHQERERAAMIRKELESHLGAANVDVEEFSLAPGGYLSPYPLGALFMLGAALLNISAGHGSGVSSWFTALVALAFSIVALLLVILEFTLGLELVDPLLKQAKSVNVIGRMVQPGTGNVKRLLILGGHHDSAWENTWIGFLGNVKRLVVPSGRRDSARENNVLLILGYLFFIASGSWFIAFIVMLAMSLVQLAGIIVGHPDIVGLGTLGPLLLIYPIVPSIIFGLFFNRGRMNGGTVPGAADNLSASALVVAMCRFLVQNPAYIPAGTEIRFISFGGEEAGLRGSRRYVKRHLDELKRLDTRLLNFETVADREIVILTSDINGTQKNSPEMVKSAVAAAQRAEVPYQVKPALFGEGSDAGPFSQAGLKAATLFPCRMPQQMIDFYHQKWDAPEILTIEPLLNVLKLTLEWVCSGGEGE